VAVTAPASFHAVTGFSPIQFQKQIRLQQSRLLLLAGADDVAALGFRVGHDSASQFNREYRRHFGLPPGRVAVRPRAGVPGRTRSASATTRGRLVPSTTVE
jgi:transcriptional regulator GlxA family with amidase domain